jgi:hypothetical protein
MSIFVHKCSKQGCLVTVMHITGNFSEYFIVTFLVEDQKILGHRILLAAANSKFRSMLTGSMKESVSNEVKIEGVTVKGFQVTV